jgi:hypothetical protein
MLEESGSALDSPAAASIPFEFTGNLVYLTAYPDGSRPLRFILETGAGMTGVDRATARELGLRTVGEVPVSGADEKSVNVQIAELPELRLGGLTLPRLPVAVHSFERIQAHAGRRFDGLLGFDVLSRFVNEIDYAGRRLRLHDTLTFRYTGFGEKLAFRLDLNLVHVPARIHQPGRRPLDGEFVVDTGAGGRNGLVFAAPFVAQHGLPAPGQHTLAVWAAGLGISGAVSAEIGYIEGLDLGALRLTRPVALFSRDRRGFLSWPGRAGVIGNEILRRARIILDYSRRELILEKNERWEDPFEFDMSGLTLSAEGDGLDVVRVTQVVEGSPAAEAGIRSGDVIAAVNGHPAGGFRLHRLRELFLGERRRYTLTIERPGGTLDVRLETRRLI